MGLKREHDRWFVVLLTAAFLGFSALLLLMDPEPGSLRVPRVADAAAVFLYVAPSGLDSGTCLTATAPCRTIQYAVDQAASGSTLDIAQGTYTQTNVRPRSDITTTGSVTQVAYLTKTLKLVGGYPTTNNFASSFPLTQPTTLDALGKGRGVYVANGITATLFFLIVTNGNASGMGGGSATSDDAGGGIYVHASTLIIDRDTVISNTADSGGGVYLHTANACTVCTFNIIISNTAKFGGGIFLRDSPNVTLTNNVITGNVGVNGTGGDGGGLYLYNSPAAIEFNTISANHGGAGGGGIFLHNSAATIRGNTISYNGVLQGGGGLYLEGSDAQVNNNVIVSNTTSTALRGGAGAFIDPTSGASFSSNVIRWNVSAEHGGGVFVEDDVPFVNNVIADNSAASEGSGVYIASSSPQFKHTTIARNLGGDGSAVRLISSTVYFSNTIMVSHTIGFSLSVGSTVHYDGMLAFSNTRGNFGGSGSAFNGHDHYGDPLFANDGYHLTLPSNAINLGINAGVTTDIDSDARPFGFAPDLGADEFIPLRIFLPLIIR